MLLQEKRSGHRSILQILGHRFAAAKLSRRRAARLRAGLYLAPWKIGGRARPSGRRIAEPAPDQTHLCTVGPVQGNPQANRPAPRPAITGSAADFTLLCALPRLGRSALRRPQTRFSADDHRLIEALLLKHRPGRQDISISRIPTVVVFIENPTADTAGHADGVEQKARMRPALLLQNYAPHKTRGPGRSRGHVRSDLSIPNAGWFWSAPCR
jgi:hypothetical protein